ncbi:putative F-box domain, leucine-rich repeat domain superfamily, F-box-like domain superfamily [Helianthus annuus]|nr:putative F-box domain, leucine-rich repeat domain superfamily, F-box-like domain superfamily [Helianthus annuus]KAJ0445952.1 putative F-box domain-containing protein [Helianthus annuus]
MLLLIKVLSDYTVMGLWSYLNFLYSLKNIFLVIDYEGYDRLSSLPDDLIHKILSFIGIKDAINTCVLSSRWRYIWTTLPYLNFSQKNLRTSYVPSKFVTDVLTHRNNLIGLSSITLSYGRLNWYHVEKTLSYALRYDVQKLKLKSLYGHDITGPVSLFNSQSLKHLTLYGGYLVPLLMPTSKWELLGLTTLRLMYGLEGFRICHPRLSHLRIYDGKEKLFRGDQAVHISKDTLHSLENLDLGTLKADASKIFGLLQHLHGVKFLALNVELVEFLSASMELISSPPSPFTNLKSLEFYEVFRPLEKPLSTEIMKYFLDGSPSASFKLTTYEERLQRRRDHNHIDPPGTQTQHHIRIWSTKMTSSLKYLIEQVKAKF